MISFTIEISEKIPVGGSLGHWNLCTEPGERRPTPYTLKLVSTDGLQLSIPLESAERNGIAGGLRATIDDKTAEMLVAAIRRVRS